MNENSGRLMLPEAVTVEIERLQLQGGSRGTGVAMPGYLSWRVADGRELWRPTMELTVAEAEQACEYHMRRGRRALDRFQRTGSKYSLRTAGDAFWRSWAARCRYHDLLGIKHDDGLMPFDVPKEPPQ